MTEQAYYRLDELPAMGITEGKLRYLLEQQQVTPTFFMHNERFIVGGYLNNKFVGFAVADYSGLVTIHKQLIPELLTKGKVSVKQVLLLQKERIRVVATEYPFQVNMPNTYIDSWQQTDLNKLDWQAYPALSMPSENVGVLHQFVDMLQGFSGSNVEKTSDFSRFTADLPNLELVVLSKELRLQNTCIRGIELETKLSATQDNLEKPSSHIEHLRAIDELIIRLLKDLPNYRPSELWEILKSDSKRTERKYDFNEILDEVDKSELTWSEGELLNRLKKKSFFNLVRILRLREL